MAKLLFNIFFFFFSFLFFITRVEHRKVSHDHHRVTKGVTEVTEWSHHMELQVTVTVHNKEIS